MVVSLLSRVQFLVIPWAIAQQAHLSMRFSRQEHWSGLPFSSPAALTNWKKFQGEVVSDFIILVSGRDGVGKNHFV